MPMMLCMGGLLVSTMLYLAFLVQGIRGSERLIEKRGAEAPRFRLFRHLQSVDEAPQLGGEHIPADDGIFIDKQPRLNAGLTRWGSW